VFVRECAVDDIAACISARTDINECEDENLNATCLACNNLDGNYSCTCAAGFYPINNIACKGNQSSVIYHVNVSLLYYVRRSFHLLSQSSALSHFTSYAVILVL